MRRTTATLALLSILALTGCGNSTAPAAQPTGTGTAVAPGANPTDLLDCSPVLKGELDPTVFDTSKCWTSSDVAETAIAHGETLFELVKIRNTNGSKLVARNASDGKKLWESPAFDSVTLSQPNPIELHDFSVGGTAAIAVGYSLSKDGYRIVVLDGKTGKELNKRDAPFTPKEVTWGSGAVALVGYVGEVSTLTLKGSDFSTLTNLPWDTLAPGAGDNLSKPVVGNHVVYLTQDRLVLDMARTGSGGAVITDAKGVKIATLPTGPTVPDASFCGDFGLLDLRDGSPAKWIGLEDGKPRDRPGCKAGDYFGSGVVGGVSVSVKPIGDSVVAADGKVVAVGGAGIYGTDKASFVPLPKAMTHIYGASSTTAFDARVTYSLSTGQATPITGMKSVNGVATVVSPDGTFGVFQGPWGVGGAPVKAR